MCQYGRSSRAVTSDIIGFSSGVLSIFPNLPELPIVLMTFILILAIAYTSARFALRVQLLILAIVGLSLFSIFLGSFAIGDQPGMVNTPVLWGDFPDGNFWQVFAVFFPAVTGIMVGISMSGDLKDPRKSIPIGTMSAIGLTLVIYLLLAIWLSRVATVDELLNIDPGNIVMADKAAWSWAVVAGLLGATFSSALASMVAAPRVMQALGQHQILPSSNFVAEESATGEPRHALLGKILRPAADVARPLVARGVLAVVHRHERELVELARDVAFGVAVAGGQARPHGDSEQRVVVEAHRRRQRSHLTVVHHFHGNVAEGFLHFQEQIPDPTFSLLTMNTAK